MKKLLVLPALVAVLVLAGSAGADPGAGATVQNYAYCSSSPFATWCWDVKTVTRQTTTPSGNVSYVTNGTSDSTISFPFSDCTSRKSEPLHLHWLRKGDEEHSYSARYIQRVVRLALGRALARVARGW